jgi:hypothetical protein
MAEWRYPPFLTSALDGGEWSASRSCCFTSGERAPGIHWAGGWVDPIVGLDGAEKKKSWECWELNPGHNVSSQLLYQLSYPDLIT